ncbi:Ger(x)C family spore germination protein [Terribacillus sp. AE2B 122]|uniref:Ger(x)C family spore germination protein n=1 Tax=Terribacillus sp. AE2B 122 TaxID=1331902 RepID=UPI0015840EF9|nr:Ger(x)C family spore germination protein [Terribacillus sp. AE2B 122]
MIRKICICVVALLFLCGCWDSSDIEDISFVIGFGLDSSENEQNPIKHTTQIAVTKKKGVQGVAPQGKIYQNLTVEGSSVQNILRSLSLQLPYPVYTDHLESIIINQETASTYDLSILLDQMLRDNVTRLSPLVVFSKQPASDVLNTNIEGEIPSSYISSIFENQTSTLEILPAVRLGEVAANLLSQTSFVLPNVEKQKNTVKVDGAGVVKGKERKLIGFLSVKEVEGVNWLSGEGRAGVLEFKDEKNNTIVYEVQTYKTKVKPKFQNGRIAFQVQIRAEGWITEDWSKVAHNLSENYVTDLERLASDEVESLVSGTLNKLQKDYKTDVVDFSESFRIAYPREYETMKKEWDEYFAKADVNCQVSIKVVNTGDVVK